MRSVLPFLLLMTLSLICGCQRYVATQSFFKEPSVDYNQSIAVLPLENLTVHPNAGLIVQQLLITELYQRKIFSIQEDTKLRYQAKMNDLHFDQLYESFHAKDVCDKLNVDAVLIGSVSEFGYQHGLHEEPTVGLNLRLVSKSHGQVIWASSHSVVGRGYIGRESVNRTAQIAIREMVDTLRPVEPQ